MGSYPVTRGLLSTFPAESFSTVIAMARESAYDLQPKTFASAAEDVISFGLSIGLRDRDVTPIGLGPIECDAIASLCAVLQVDVFGGPVDSPMIGAAALSKDTWVLIITKLFQILLPLLTE